MASHAFTVDFRNKTWVFFKGTQVDLDCMKVWVEERFSKDQYEIGTPDIIKGVGDQYSFQYIQGFAFTHRDDAMMFKLSW